MPKEKTPTESWTYEYRGNTIIVDNFLTECQLYVNGELQDKKKALLQFNASLNAKLDSGEEIVAYLRAELMSVNCFLKVDGILLQPLNYQDHFMK